MPVNSDQQALGGLLVRKECWTFSLRGKLLIVLVVLAVGLAVIRGLYPFLAVTQRTSGEILVVEGWINAHTIEQAAHEYKAAHYRDVLVVKDAYAIGNKWESGRHMAEYIADELVRLGIPKDRVHLVFCDVLKKDRTYHAALAVRKWIQAQGIMVKAIDVVTLGPHARRSRLLFQKAFGTELKVGVIAMDERGYDPIHWWRSSEGVREVPFEGVAYLYVKLFFHP
jgi:uncharacterized SAM-binding protein YcdF (DUF218 family)